MPESHEKKKRNICMIAYTNYMIDARVRREAETLAALPEYRVTMLVNKRNALPSSFTLESVEVKESMSQNIAVTAIFGTFSLIFIFFFMHLWHALLFY